MVMLCYIHIPLSYTIYSISVYWLYTVQYVIWYVIHVHVQFTRHVICVCYVFFYDYSTSINIAVSLQLCINTKLKKLQSTLELVEKETKEKIKEEPNGG